MCFIQTGHFNKIDKKRKKTSGPITAQDMAFFYNKVIKGTELGNKLEMIVKDIDMVYEYSQPSILNLSKNKK